MVGKLEILCAKLCGKGGLSTQNEPDCTFEAQLCKKPHFLYWSEVKVTQSRQTLCDPVDCHSPGPSVHGILQARILEWVAMLSSRGSYQPRDRTQVSCNVGGFFTVLSELSGKPIFFIDSTYVLDSSPLLFWRLHPFYLLVMMKLWIIFSVMAGEVMKG